MGLSNTAPEHRNPYFTARQNDKKRRGLPHLNGQIETAWHFHQPFAICFVNSRSRVQVSSPAPRIPHSDAVKSTTLLPRLFVGLFNGRFEGEKEAGHPATKGPAWSPTQPIGVYHNGQWAFYTLAYAVGL
jgi:hypothetical protein